MEEPRQSPPDYDRIRSVIASVEAPHALRMRVEDERDRTFTRRTVVKRMKLTGVLAGAAAALGVAMALVVPGQSTPGIDSAIALSARAPAAAAPAPVPGHPELLNAQGGDVSSPTWSGPIGWKPSGRRDDSLGNRHATTIFYDNAGGARIGYTIVNGAALAWPKGASTTMSRGVEIHVLSGSQRNVVVWREHGHTCVLSAPSRVPAGKLVALAANVGHYYA